VSSNIYLLWLVLLRPDYIRAIKMDKPGVARKIVKAIRFGSPPGRYESC
jgi:hypothetical protein